MKDRLLSKYESSTYGHDRYDNTSSRSDPYKYKVSCQNALESRIDEYAS